MNSSITSISGVVTGGITNVSQTTPNINNNDKDRDNTLYLQINSVVIYYCSCLVSSIPGKIYLTSTHICITSTVITTTKEIYPLDSMTSEIITDRSKGMHISYFFFNFFI